MRIFAAGDCTPVPQFVYVSAYEGNLAAVIRSAVIRSAVLAIKFRLTVKEVAETFHPCRTIAEGLKLASQTFSKDVAMLSCCAA